MPPGATAGLVYGYAPDRAWTSTTLPGGRVLTADFDSARRPAGRSYTEASVAFAYAGTSERPETLTWTPTDGSAQSVGLEYDGDLLKALSFAGASAGDFAFTYNSRLQLASATLTSGADVIAQTIGRDDDALVTLAGPFTIGRAGPAGAQSSVSDGVLSATFTYDALGRVATRTHVVNGVTIYDAVQSFGADGLLSSRDESVDGETRALVFEHDADGQLLGVSVDGESSETYSYDLNGNRSSEALAATFDTQDRLTSLGGDAVVVDHDGHLVSRGADTFTFSTRGELLVANVGGTVVSYTYDALGRRTSRAVSAATTQFLYGNSRNPLQLTAARDPGGTLSFFHYDAAGHLIAIEQGVTHYYVATASGGHATRRRRRRRSRRARRRARCVRPHPRRQQPELRAGARLRRWPGRPADGLRTFRAARL